MYSVYGQIRYKKSVWGVVKSRIDKNCAAGMEEFFGDLQSTLQKKFCTPPSKGKRSSKRSIFYIVPWEKKASFRLIFSVYNVSAQRLNGISYTTTCQQNKTSDSVEYGETNTRANYFDLVNFRYTSGCCVAKYCTFV